jgi:DNA (cytosine-5)-methyltransferase 1
MSRRPTCLSIFSGGGGLDIGFEEAGWHIIGATDIESDCAATFKQNRPKIPFKVGSANEYSSDFFSSFVDSDTLSDLDCLIGGPPCPAFSKSRFYRKEKPRGLGDPIADETMRGYIRALTELRPKMFVLENVKGLTYKVHSGSLDYITRHIEDLGYKYEIWKINAADYGVPQIRERAFIVGSQDIIPTKPEATHSKDAPNTQHDLPTWVGVGSVISDLPSNGQNNIPGHFAGGKHHHLLRDVPPGNNYLFFTKKRNHPDPKFEWRSRYWSFLLKLSPDMPSWTIQARRSNNMGPFHWDSRILTIDEVKRIQTFPDEWSLLGSIESQWRQVGNAVPCLLAKKIANAMIGSCNKNYDVPFNGRTKISAIRK